MATDNWYALSTQDVLQRLETDAASGLSAQEVERRRAQYGANELPREGGTPPWKILLGQFTEIMVVVLLVRIPRPVQTPEGRAMQGTIWQEALVGFRFLWARRPMLVMVAAATLVQRASLGYYPSVAFPAALGSTAEAVCGVLVLRRLGCRGRFDSLR